MHFIVLNLTFINLVAQLPQQKSQKRVALTSFVAIDYIQSNNP